MAIGFELSGIGGFGGGFAGVGGAYGGGFDGGSPSQVGGPQSQDLQALLNGAAGGPSAGSCCGQGASCCSGQGQFGGGLNPVSDNVGGFLGGRF